MYRIIKNTPFPILEIDPPYTAFSNYFVLENREVELKELDSALQQIQKLKEVRVERQDILVILNSDNSKASIYFNEPELEGVSPEFFEMPLESFIAIAKAWLKHWGR
jgi:hypothetical protein